MVIWATAGFAAPVVCDPVRAAELVRDAVVDPRRAPVTHPWLVPGLAAASGEPEVVRAMAALCAPGAELSVERGDVWEAGGFAAYTLGVASITQEGCAVVRRRVELTVGVDVSGARYALRAPVPDDRTPRGDCPEPAVWREEQVLEGLDGPVRLLLIADRVGDEVVDSAVVVRRATPDGWTEQVLVRPAPPRLLGGTDGPELRLVADGRLVVASGDRRTVDGVCVPVPGQTVWREGGSAEVGRAAAARLARAGAWRFAGQDGWFLVLGQDDEEDLDLVEPRRRRRQRRTAELLSSWTSADFPELNPGYVFIAPDPFADRADAERAALDFTRSRQVYVKRAWTARDGCAR